MNYDIKILIWLSKGKDRIEWAGIDMPVLKSIREEFAKTKPFHGITIGACLHVTTETANLMITLKEGGANVYLCASNPLSTQDDVAASLVKDYDIPVFAIKGEDNNTFYKHLRSILDKNPNILIDDGADLISTAHKEYEELTKKIFGAMEETTTGVIRLKSYGKDKALKFPVIAVNDALTKHMFDNRYGTGQSTLDGILRATNRLIAGSTFVVAGYGWCGKGVAMRARGMGANVIVTEVDPLKALEARMDGFGYANGKSSSIGRYIFVTVTGNTKVIRQEHFEVIKNGAIVSNSGHFDVEIDVRYLESVALEINERRPMVKEYIINTKSGKKRIYVLAEGRLVNLAAAEGHPASVMDMSFANQALSAEFILNNHSKLEKDVYKVPDDIDQKVAKLKLDSMGIEIDILTPEQIAYMSSWEHGT